RLLVDKEVDAALTVYRNSTLPVSQYGGESHVPEVVVQPVSLPGRCGELDELEAVDAHRVLEGGDLHARIGRAGCGGDVDVHGWPPETWAATAGGRRRGGSKGVRGADQNQEL